MDSTGLTLSRATKADAAAIATCFSEGFTQGPLQQTQFYAQMFPATAGTNSFFKESVEGQFERENGRTHFIKVVDASKNRLAGFAKWTPPNTENAYWVDYAPEMDAELCNKFFGAMAEHRSKLMGQRPHWYLEVMCVSVNYQRQGVGKMMMDYGVDLIDRDGLEAYVDSSPVAKGLYQKYGFKEKEHQSFPEPFEWYTEAFMTRPAR